MGSNKIVIRGVISVGFSVRKYLAQNAWDSLHNPQKVRLSSNRERGDITSLSDCDRASWSLWLKDLNSDGIFKIEAHHLGNEVFFLALCRIEFAFNYLFGFHLSHNRVRPCGLHSIPAQPFLLSFRNL